MPRKANRNCDENPLEKGIHAPDLRNLAVYFIEQYFEDKLRFDGQEIDHRQLLSSENIKTVLRTPFDDATFNFIHDHCLARLSVDPKYEEASVPWTVYCLLCLLKEMQRQSIPKEFQPGMLLLYFKICKGFEILPAPIL